MVSLRSQSWLQLDLLPFIFFLESSPAAGPHAVEGVGCISGYMGKDIKPSHLLSTKCPAMQSVATPHSLPALPRGQTPEGSGNSDSLSCKCIRPVSLSRLLGGSIAGWWDWGTLTSRVKVWILFTLTLFICPHLSRFLHV